MEHPQEGLTWRGPNIHDVIGQLRERLLNHEMRILGLESLARLDHPRVGAREELQEVDHHAYYDPPAADAQVLEAAD